VVRSRLGKFERMAYIVQFDVNPLDIEEMLKSLRLEDSASLLASSSSLCFVIMPFSPGYELVYHQVIKPAAETFDLKVLRADDIYSPGVIT